MKRSTLRTALPVATALAMALAGLTILTLPGCGPANSTTTAPAKAASGTPISAANVIEQQITETQEFSGRLEAIERVAIRSRVAGFITEVKFKPGSEVKKGDVLFVIDPRPFQAEASRTEAAFAAAGAKAELARIELNRAAGLLAEKAIPQRDFDEKSSNLKELDANRQAAQAQHAAAKLNLGYSSVHSPIDGRVGKAEITVGNLIDASAMLTTVVSQQRIYASFDGDEDTYLRVGALAHSGKTVRVNIGLANETGFPHEGKLEFVDNALDAQTGSVRMRAIFLNADNKLAPGLFARVQLVGGNGGAQLTRALLINERAIGTDQDRKFVFVVGEDNKAEYRLVQLGKTIDGLRIVRSGLTAGEKIVVNGLQRVRPGAQLAPQMVAMNFDPAAPVTASTNAADPANATAAASTATKPGDAAAKSSEKPATNATQKNPPAKDDKLAKLDALSASAKE